MSSGTTTSIDFLEQCCLEALQNQPEAQEEEDAPTSASAEEVDAQLKPPTPVVSARTVRPVKPALGTFKKVLFSPDGSLVAASTESRHLVIVKGVSSSSTPSSTSGSSSSSGVVEGVEKNAKPWSVAVQTAEPLIDYAWCPFMTGPEENATLIASCRSNPVYLFDGETGDKRAAYVYLGDNDVPRTAHALHWDSESMTRICCGYEASDLALFDITRPGKVPTIKYNCKKLTSGNGGKSIIGALDYCTSRGLYAIGSLKGPGTIELMSQNTNTCSGVLKGKKGSSGGGGVVQLQFDSSGTYLFAGNRGGGVAEDEGDVVVWDLRNLMGGPVHRIHRGKNHKQQPMYFSLASVKDNNTLAATPTACDSFNYNGSGPTAGFRTDFFSGDLSLPAKVLKLSPWSTRTCSEEIDLARGGNGGQEQSHPVVNAVSTFVHPTTGKVFVAASTGSRVFPLQDRFSSASDAVVEKYQGRQATPWKSHEMVAALAAGVANSTSPTSSSIQPISRTKRDRESTASSTKKAPVVFSDSEDDGEAAATAVPTLKVFAL